MRLIVSTVSHQQGEMIARLGALASLAAEQEVHVICRDNIEDSDLKAYCHKHSIHYIANTKAYGFSKNNNLNFQYYHQYLRPQKDDWFLLLNPDVQLLPETYTNLKTAIKKNNGIIAADLFLGPELSCRDNNLRCYPTLKQFVLTYLCSEQSTFIDRSSEKLGGIEAWVSGAFLAISSYHYQQLGGLDEKYYMYCEDIDFCYRAKANGLPITLDFNTKAIHYRQRASKKMFSRFFFWHVTSVLKFCCLPKGLKAKKTSLTECFVQRESLSQPDKRVGISLK
ncbi:MULTISPECIES: glycosyltransferase family 2 protein [Vibrio]|uniref:glycosyltransferase family 2 protein n=1 Tax=Vibrio TaxID=662 RepID=UPI0006486B99|nr:MULTISPECIES: glycosyltransferase family 2 protein [Vibrio]MBY7668155.1 glycosyltransferase family 2 protein [Vibrio anguillarum]NAX45385.1 glycosyltransferase family 2 protein [Vibrio sp. V25_P4S6T154]OXX47704.1 rhamnosyl transferase [Vibrio sp. V17_P4S1T151]OXX61407.1 rhamnosyl transferase [Vibrio sp. V15_P4S5T153]OXX67041.1 rhamnosyl transferase [Vibrio sp. V20_P4S3T152]